MRLLSALLLAALPLARAAAADAPAVPRGLFGLTVLGEFADNADAAKAGGFSLAVIGAYEEHLDALRARGMKGVVSFWLDKEQASSPAKWAEFEAGVAEKVERLKKHPALAAWYLADEPDGEGVPVERIAELAAFVRARDPKTPLMCVFDSPKTWARYFPYVDIVAVDPYLRRHSLRPGYAGVEVVTEWLTIARQDLSRLKLDRKLWVVLGAFDERPRKKDKPADYKKPTPGEFRDMTARALEKKVDGILVYSFAFEGGEENEPWSLAGDDPKLWAAVREAASAPEAKR